jgi:hypothetical protein
MALPYRAFATWILNDLAERTETRYADRVTYSGNHINIQSVLPIQAENETPGKFALRLKEFRKRLPRRSDFSERLALAVEALIRTGETPWSAASLVLDELNRVPQQSAEQHFQLAKVGIPYKQINPRIGTTKRGHRSKKKRQGFSDYYRQVETIRTQASRFRRKRADFRRLFEGKFGTYRFQFDPEWDNDDEAVYRQRMVNNEKKLGPYAHWTAMATIALARFLHARERFGEAEPVYQLALERWRKATPVSEDRRELAVSSILSEIENCRSGRPLGPVPIYVPSQGQRAS